MGLFEISPETSWTLDEWRAIVGRPSPSEIISIGKSLDAPAEVVSTIAKWKAGTVQTWFRGRIADRADAVAMIAVLREAGRRSGTPLFSDDRLRAHADLFMRSAASRPGGFTPLGREELAAIAGLPVPDIDHRYDDSDLLRKVYPPPPIVPFGRETEIASLLGVIGESVVTSIVSDPGNGKTALAWHAARRALFGGLVTGMDWNTDKRVMITAIGEAKQVDKTGIPLTFDALISSAIRRFGWDDLRLAPEQRRAALVAERLAGGRYLLIVDNLETVPQATEMVTQLRGLLEPRGELSPVASRALITSRVALDGMPGVRHVPIGGLALEPSAAFVRALEHDGGYVARASEGQIEQLWLLTRGNPLLLQIAVTRGAMQNGRFEEILRDLDTGAGFMIVFDRLFGPLVTGMHEENARATFVAVYAALLHDLTIDELRRAWEREYHDESEFEVALATVLRYGLLRPLPGATGEFAIHPMVRLYLRHLYGG